jgi:hypothetical protein
VVNCLATRHFLVVCLRSRASETFFFYEGLLVLYDVDLINLICVSNEGSILLSTLIFIRRCLPKSPRVQTKTLFKLCTTKDASSVLCSVCEVVCTEEWKVMVRVAVCVTLWKVLSTGSTLPQDDTNTHFCHHHTKRALLSLLVVCDRFSEGFVYGLSLPLSQ